MRPIAAAPEPRRHRHAAAALRTLRARTDTNRPRLGRRGGSYKRALGAAELWSLGSVIGLAIDGAPFFLHEQTNTGFVSPSATSVRVEVFVDDPDASVQRAIDAGADGTTNAARDHEAPWGVHRQGGFRDPFGHAWHVGDHSPLHPSPRK
jgi:PhnB protein